VIQDDAGSGAADPVVKKVAEKNVPYERFEVVNKKAQETEQKLKEAEQREAMLHRAYASGYATIEAYQAADTWARANNYAGIEGYRAHQEEQAELQRYTASLDQRDDLSDAARSELLVARQQQVETQKQQRELNAQIEYLRSHTLEQSIETARLSLGGSLDPELETILRSSEAPVVHRVTAAFKRQQDTRVAALEAELKAVRAQTAAAVVNGKGEYAATKLRQQQTPPPEGRGGQAPAPVSTATPTGFKSRSFAELIFRQNPKG
jgi:hypothetical protein